MVICCLLVLVAVEGRVLQGLLPSWQTTICFKLKYLKTIPRVIGERISKGLVKRKSFLSLFFFFFLLTWFPVYFVSFVFVYHFICLIVVPRWFPCFLDNLNFFDRMPSCLPTKIISGVFLYFCWECCFCLGDSLFFYRVCFCTSPKDVFRYHMLQTGQIVVLIFRFNFNEPVTRIMNGIIHPKSSGKMLYKF